MNTPRVLVKIACFNEVENLPFVLSALPAGVEVLVIDDGSTDGTGEVAERLGATVLRHPLQMGQGTADQTGFMWALSRDYDVIVEMDGDGQHDPADVPRFIAKLNEEPRIDYVTGSRTLGSSFPEHHPMRRFFLPLFTGLINSLTGYEMTDAMCGFKAYRANSLRGNEKALLAIRGGQYSAAEMFIRFSRVGLELGEIPVSIRKRRSGISRKGLFRYGLGVLWTIVRTSLGLVRGKVG